MEVKLLSADATMPQKANESDAGYDVSASRDYTLQAWEHGKIDTDIAIAVPPGTYGRLAPRSGLALKNGIHVGAGVVDQKYQGHVGVVLFNLSDSPFVVRKGDRIAQLILEKIATHVAVTQVAEFSQSSDRGTAGFGSSGTDKKLDPKPAATNDSKGEGRADQKEQKSAAKRALVGATQQVEGNGGGESGEEGVKRQKRGGKIIVLAGPMFASKTTNLSAFERRYTLAKKRCLVVKYMSDNRFSHEQELVTHDKVKIPANAKTDALSNIPADLLDAVDVLLLDEGHFYADLVEFSLEMASQGKVVVVAGLMTTWEKKPFPTMCTLVAHADEIIDLKAVCTLCGEDALYSRRLSDKTDLQVIGGADMYTARCRFCFDK